MTLKFGVLARFQSIFLPERRYWYAWLVVRRVLLAVIYLIGQMRIDIAGGDNDTENATANSWSTVSFFVLTCSVLLQEWLKPFRLAIDNLLEQCTLILLMTVLYIDLASPDGGAVSTFVFALVVAIFLVVSTRTLGLKYMGKVRSGMALIPCCSCFQKQPGELEEGLYTNADSLSGQHDNALHVSWGAAGATTEGWLEPEPKPEPEPEPKTEPAPEPEPAG